MSALCEKYGFDAAGRARRLRMVGLGEADHACVEALRQQIFVPHGEAIIEDFYRYMREQEESRRFITNESILNSLKQTQRDYLYTLGQDFASEAYFEGRLQVGLAHVRIGLPLNFYHCAYAELQCQIMARLAASGSMDTRLEQCLVRLTTLDMSLAMEVYHRARMAELEEDISQLQTSQAALAREMRLDDLTGLFTRHCVLERLSLSIESAEGAGLIMADLDYFKAVNDTYGHPLGDQVLREAADRIHAAVRDADVVGRYGGEEFIIVLPGASLELTEVIAERIRQAFVVRPLHIGDVALSLTISLGCIHAAQGMEVDDAVAQADTALYEAKGRGRNQVVCR